MTIRLMNIEDYDRVYALWMATPGIGLNDVDDSRAGIAHYLSRNPTTCFVAEVEGELAGAVLSGHDGRRGYISHTAVGIAHRRQGIGAELVTHAMAALRAEGISKVALVVFARNELGNAFWSQQGFTRRDDLVYRNKNLITLERIDT